MSIILTELRLKELKISRQGYKVKQLEILGVGKRKGWWKRLQNKEVTEEQFEAAYDARKTGQRKLTQAQREAKKRRKLNRWLRRKGKLPKKKKQSKKKRISAHKKKYYAYLASAEWAEIRNDLFTNRGRKCEYCGSTHRLQIHHLTYVNVFKEEPEDLVILCAACHKDEHR